MQQVLVLNASYEPLNVCSVRRAHVLVWKGKAEVLEGLPKGLRSATDTYVLPHVIRLAPSIWHLAPRLWRSITAMSHVLVPCRPLRKKSTEQA